MPWHIEQRGSRWCVIKDADGENEGCHDTEAKARRQLRALYANEDQGVTMREREFASFPLQMARVETSGNRLKGYASVFRHPIPSGPDQVTYIEPGAFKRTLKARTPQVLFNHGQDPRYGELPIGTVIDAHEDDRGLWTEVELHDGPDNENIKAALRSGALRAQSIQFEDLTPMADRYNADRTERHIREVKLWEFGPVTFPANDAATASLHSASGMLASLAGNGAVTSEEDQPEAPADAARLTWAINESRKLERYDAEQADWLRRIQGGRDGSPRTTEGAAR